MQNSIQAIRGMNDILPAQTGYWQHVEGVIRRLVAAYGYQEIRMPIVEKTELFKRSIGEVTDIVEKEMYTFDDRNGDSLTLRPEGTAVCVRAGIENGLLYNQVQRLWYLGPMFRHERPQRGRYRQFHQIGVEAFGLDGPDIDAEMILMTARLLKELGLYEYVELQINSLGTAASRQAYRQRLFEYLSTHQDQLDEDSKRRLHTNPLRVLDSKNPALKDIIAAAPRLLEHLDQDSRAHFEKLCQCLDAAGIRYVINPCLVRGLDYYCKTVFEWVTDKLGAQGTVCAGGRYDGLVEQLGGKPTTAVGFAAGLERLVEMIKEVHAADFNVRPHAYLVLMGEQAEAHGMLLAERLRNQLPAVRLLTNCSGGSFKAQFKKADKSGAGLALIIGDDEVAQGMVAVKHLREEKEQTMCTHEALIALLRDYVTGNP